MNDYLDNLIAKSLGQAEVVAPRPMSLFEPLSSDAGQITSDQYLLEQDGEPPRMPAAVTPGDAPPTGVMPAAVMPTGVVPTGVVMDAAMPPKAKAELSTKAPPPRAIQSDRLAQHLVQSIDRSLSQSVSLPMPNQSISGDVGQRADGTERAALVAPQLVDGHPTMNERMPSRVVEHASIPADRETFATPEAPPYTPHQSRSPERAEAIIPAHTLLIAPALSQERESHANRAAAPQPAPEAEPSAAPTIKITIGRVDVRAVITERPEPRPAPATRNTALTLEEYLNRRSGGKL